MAMKPKKPNPSTRRHGLSKPKAGETTAERRRRLLAELRRLRAGRSIAPEDDDEIEDDEDSPLETLQVDTASMTVPFLAEAVASAPRDAATFEREIRARLAWYLGSDAAADAWLNSTATGYPKTAMEAIREGKGDVVMSDLDRMRGPSPSYA